MSQVSSVANFALSMQVQRWRLFPSRAALEMSRVHCHKHLKKVGARVAVISPLYSSIKPEWKQKMKKVYELQVPLSWRFEYCGLWHLVHEGV